MNIFVCVFVCVYTFLSFGGICDVKAHTLFSVCACVLVI